MLSFFNSVTWLVNVDKHSRTSWNFVDCDVWILIIACMRSQFVKDDIDPLRVIGSKLVMAGVLFLPELDIVNTSKEKIKKLNETELCKLEAWCIQVWSSLGTHYIIYVQR